MNEELAQTMDMGAEVPDGSGSGSAADMPAEERREGRESREEVIAANPETVGAGITEVHQEVEAEVKAGEAAPQLAATPAPSSAAAPKSDLAPTSVSAPTVATPNTSVPEQANTGSAPSTSGAEAELRAATALRDAYRVIPGVVADIIQGNTVDEVKASYEAAQKAYSDIKAAVMREQGLAVPPAHGGSPVTPVPNDPLSMILAGVAQPKR